MSTFFTALAVLVLDRLSKTWVASNLPFEQPWAPIPAISELFTFTYIRNSGAAFGMFRQAGGFFGIVSVLVVIGLFVWYDRLPVQHFIVRLAIGLVTGGALGNLVDRLRTGYVVDFIHFRYCPIFNIADGAVVAGMIVLGLYMLLEEENREPKAESVSCEESPNASS